MEFPFEWVRAGMPAVDPSRDRAPGSASTALRKIRLFRKYCNEIIQGKPERQLTHNHPLTRNGQQTRSSR